MLWRDEKRLHGRLLTLSSPFNPSQDLFARLTTPHPDPESNSGFSGLNFLEKPSVLPGLGRTELMFIATLLLILVSDEGNAERFVWVKERKEDGTGGLSGKLQSQSRKLPTKTERLGRKEPTV